MKTLPALLGCILAGVLLPAGAIAQAPKVIDEQAKAEALRAYQKGMAHYNLNEYDQAILQFEAGYRAVPQAAFLYNIAQAHRLANRPQKALEFYRKYLRQDPGAKNFREVQERIEALEKLLAESARPPEQTLAPTGMVSTGTMPPPNEPARPKPPEPTPGPAKVSEPAPAAVKVPQPAPALSLEPEPPPAPLAVSAPAPQQRRSRVVPIVLGVVGGALVVGAAVGLGVYFGTRPPDPAVWQAVMP
ncbi:MAG: tetratricopeptide repeat protein [Myxococcales bacterium]|nr:tetratricopeptide repeat protein [Myxococcales bacterium]